MPPTPFPPCLTTHANEAVVRLIAETLDCPRANVEIIRGETSRHKVVRVRGVAATDVVARLGITA